MKLREKWSKMMSKLLHKVCGGVGGGDCETPGRVLPDGGRGRRLRRHRRRLPQPRLLARRQRGRGQAAVLLLRVPCHLHPGKSMPAAATTTATFMLEPILPRETETLLQPPAIQCSNASTYQPWLQLTPPVTCTRHERCYNLLWEGIVKPDGVEFCTHMDRYRLRNAWR